MIGKRFSDSFDFETSVNNSLYLRQNEINSCVTLAIKEDENFLYKSSLLLMYSHYEGFSKDIFFSTFHYIKSRKIRFDQLSSHWLDYQIFNNFLYGKKGQFSDFKDASRLVRQGNITNGTLTYNANIISTKSNLFFDDLEFLFDIYGISIPGQILVMKLFIDKKLLHYRNAIAHGDLDLDGGRIEFTSSEIGAIRDSTLKLLSAIKDRLILYVRNKEYS